MWEPPNVRVLSSGKTQILLAVIRFNRRISLFNIFFLDYSAVPRFNRRNLYFFLKKIVCFRVPRTGTICFFQQIQTQPEFVVTF